MHHAALNCQPESVRQWTAAGNRGSADRKTPKVDSVLTAGGAARVTAAARSCPPALTN